MKLAGLLLAMSAFIRAESLNYSISWASGLNLGEATIDFSTGKSSLNLEVGVPGFLVKDHYTSAASAGFCSAMLDKDMSHGSRKTQEHLVFDQQKQTATRKTVDGGESTVNTSACARDPLTLLQFVRKELVDGRLAPQQAVVFGAVYQVRFEYAGVQQLKIGQKAMEAERIQTTVKGPASDVTFDLFFARDARRTPVMARIPSPVGAFVVELMR